MNNSIISQAEIKGGKEEKPETKCNWVTLADSLCLEIASFLLSLSLEFRLPPTQSRVFGSWGGQGPQDSWYDAASQSALVFFLLRMNNAHSTSALLGSEKC